MWKRRVRVKEGEEKRKNETSEIEVPKLRIFVNPIHKTIFS